MTRLKPSSWSNSQSGAEGDRRECPHCGLETGVSKSYEAGGRARTNDQICVYLYTQINRAAGTPGIFWCRRSDSNRRQVCVCLYMQINRAASTPYECVALPTELFRRCGKLCSSSQSGTKVDNDALLCQLRYASIRQTSCKNLAGRGASWNVAPFASGPGRSVAGHLTNDPLYCPCRLKHKKSRTPAAKGD